MKHNQSGFTLVELIVTIAIGSLVTLAATTVLLLGLRINNRSTQTVIRQNTARVVITMLENLAAEGEITDIILKKDQDDNKVIGWEIRNAKDIVLATYSEQAIYIGGTEKDEGEAPATPLLEEVTASTISLDETGLLSISVTIDGINYDSSIFCRTMRAPKKEDTAEENKITAGTDYTVDNTKVGRTAFLNVLASQYRLAGGSPNPGLILEGGYSTGKYYSEWYVGGYDEDKKPGWNPETPWCACFVSWGLSYYDEVRKCVGSWNIQPADGVVGGVAFANVDFFANYFQSPTGEQRQSWKDAVESDGSFNIPTPGDIIFIDWDGADSEGNYDPAHVGVVLKIAKTIENNTEEVYVYTIEGNMENRIMVRRYAIDDERIMGYGIIDWIEISNQS